MARSSETRLIIVLVPLLALTLIVVMARPAFAPDNVQDNAISAGATTLIPEAAYTGHMTSVMNDTSQAGPAVKRNAIDPTIYND